MQFLTWFSGAEQAEGPVSNIVKLALGDDPTDRPKLHKPYGVAARDGVVYVCDTKIPGLCRLDFKDRSFTLLGASGPGRLRKPIHLTIDALGYKFVADAARRQIVVFGPEDAYVTAFDVPAPSHPVDVAVWEDELYVLDNDDTCGIVVLDRRTGAVLRTLGGPGVEPGKFKIPNSLCFDADGYLYVSDTLNWRIQKLTRNGEPVWTAGEPGYYVGQFGRPRGLRVAPDGVVYVADAATEIVQMYNADGQTLMYVGGPGQMPGALTLPAAVAVDATSVPYFKQYLHKAFKAEYLLFVSSQFGPHMISVFAFGAFPEGFHVSQSEIASLPPVTGASKVGAVRTDPGDEDADRSDESPPAGRGG